MKNTTWIAMFLVVATFWGGLVLTACSAFKPMVAAVPAGGGAACDFVAVQTGSTFWGAVCSDVVDLVKAGAESVKAQAYARAEPCPLTAIHRNGVHVGVVCSGIAPAVQARLDAQVVK